MRSRLDTASTVALRLIGAIGLICGLFAFGGFLFLLVIVALS